MFIDDGSGKSPWLCLEEFFLGYIRITLHMMRLDIKLLTHSAKDPELPAQDSICKEYLQTLTAVVSFLKTPFYRALSRKYPEDTREMLLRVRAKALEPPMDTARALSEWAACTLELTPRHPHLAGLLIQAIAIASALVDGSLERSQGLDGDDTDTSLPNTPPMQTLYDLVRMVDIKYQEWISKKAAFATSDLSEQLMRVISTHYKHQCARNTDLVNKLSEDLAIPLPEDARSADKSLIIFWTWKLAVLKKHIMDGRMELRVHGVEAMAPLT